METASRNVFRIVLVTLCLWVMGGPIPAVAWDPHDSEGGQILEQENSAATKAKPGELGVVVMGPASNESSTNNSSSKGNVVTVNRPVSVETVSVYLTGVPAGTTIEWAVYKSDALDGDYEQVEAVSSVVGGGDGDFESPAMGAVLVPGTFYFLCAFWDQPVTYHYSNSQAGAPLDFDFGYGTATYHQRKGAYSVFPGPASFSTGGNGNSPYRQTYRFRAVEVAEFGPTSDGSSTSTTGKGNSITVPEAMTLQSIGLYLTGVPVGTNLYWAVYRSVTLDGTYEMIWEATRPSALGGDGYFDSPAAMITLEPGWFYWIGGYWDLAATYYFSNTLPGAPQDFHTGFGSMTYHWRQTGPTPGTPNFVGGGSTGAPYQQRYAMKPGAAANLGGNSDAGATDMGSSKGNIVTVSATSTLEAFELYLTSVTGGTTLYWMVYESATLDGTYTKIWEGSRTVTAINGYFSSGPVMIDLQPGMFYWLGGFWDQNVTYWFSNTAPGGPLDFPLDGGTLTYHRRQGAFNTLPPPGTFPGGGVTNAPYWQRYVFSGSLNSIFYDGFDIGDSSVWAITKP